MKKDAKGTYWTKKKPVRGFLNDKPLGVARRTVRKKTISIFPDRTSGELATKDIALYVFRALVPMGGTKCTLKGFERVTVEDLKALGHSKDIEGARALAQERARMRHGAQVRVRFHNCY